MHHEPPRRIAALRSERLRSAISEARRAARGRTDPEARQILEANLRRHDVFIAPAQVAVIASQLAHPVRHFFHPLRSRREAQSALRAPDPDGGRFQREAADLSAICRRVPEVCRTSSRRTIDGVIHTIYVDPWSPEVAERIRLLAMPIQVDVVPAER